MSIYRPRPQRRTLLAVLVLASVTVITLDLRSSGGLFSGSRGAMGALLSPFRRGAAAVIHPVTGFFSGVAHSSATRAENERLRNENVDLRAKLDAASQNQGEVDDLRKLNNILPDRVATSVGAKVYATGTSTFEWTVEIDAGADRGIAVGYPVVSGDGLAGKVVQVRPSSAVVQLITDPGFAAGARLEQSKDIGVISGHGNGPLTLDEVDPQTPVAKGERVFTSGGSSSGFPTGIPVGAVRESVAPNAALQRTIRVNPAVQIRRLQFVKVLIYSGEKSK